MNKNLKPVVAVAGISLALSISFTAFVGCNKQPGGDESSDDSSSLPSIYDSTGDSADSTSESTPTESSSEPETQPTFTDVNETVYVTGDTVYIRNAPKVSDTTVAGYGFFGDSYKRVKYSEDWSVILIDGEEYYISSYYVSKTDPSAASANLTFTAIDKTVTITTSYANLRVSPSTGATIKYTLEKGTQLVAIGISSDNNWYKINYTETSGAETVVYIHTSVVASPQDTDDGFTAIDKTVYISVEKLNLRSAPSTVNSEILAVLTKGTSVTVIGTNSNNSWYKVTYTSVSGTTTTGYISADSNFVSETAPQ